LRRGTGRPTRSSELRRTVTKSHNRKFVSDDAIREKLARLEARYNQLLALLPTDPSEFDELDADQFAAKLADIETIASEMEAVDAEQRAILDELADRSGDIR
jgi:Tfp pilus assembly protein PilO